MLRALSKDPAGRQPTAEAFLEELVAAARSAPRQPHITAIHATPQSAATLALEHHTIPMGPGVGAPASVGGDPWGSRSSTSSRRFGSIEA